MPLSPDFTKALAEVDQFAEETRRQIRALAVQVDLEQLPKNLRDDVISTIKRKYGAIGYALEDLRDIPRVVEQVEAEIASKARARQAMEGTR